MILVRHTNVEHGINTLIQQCKRQGVVWVVETLALPKFHKIVHIVTTAMIKRHTRVHLLSTISQL